MDNDFMTIPQIVEAARNEVNNKIDDGRWKGTDYAGDNEENIFTISSMYVQWAEDEDLAQQAIDTMFEEEFNINIYE